MRPGSCRSSKKEPWEVAGVMVVYGPDALPVTQSAMSKH